jgi:two-component system, OmpR family, sensor kinase
MQDCHADRQGDSDRLLVTLEQLLGIPSADLRPALDQASTLVNEALRADKLDVFLYEAESRSLVAMGTSDTPVGRLQHQFGLNRQPIALGGPAVRVYQTGTPHLNGRVNEDPDRVRGSFEALGIQSAMDVELIVGGERRGVLQADSLQRDFFSDRDLRFLIAVSNWIGMLTHRAEIFERSKIEAEHRGARRNAEEIARITRREHDVVIPIAEGLSNAEVADRLAVAEGTVANHVANILRKLSLRTRTQIAVWAVEHGLYRTGTEVSE